MNIYQQYRIALYMVYWYFSWESSIDRAKNIAEYKSDLIFTYTFLDDVNFLRNYNVHLYNRK